MKVKITVCVDEPLKRLIKETSGDKKISDVVSEALESYVAAGSVNNRTSQARPQPPNCLHFRR